MDDIKAKKRVLIFSLSYYPTFVGGAEVAIREITNRLGADILFDMITLRFDTNLPKIEKKGNVTVYRIGLSKLNPKAEELLRFPMYLTKVLYPIGAFWKAVSLHKKNKYDTLWSVMSYMGFPAVFFKWFYPHVPFLLTIQDGDTIEHITKRTRIRMVGPLFHQIFKKASVVQTISNFLADFARLMGAKEPVIVVPNGVDVVSFAKTFSDFEIEEEKKRVQKKEGEIALVTTSRLVTKNAVEDIISALSFLSHEFVLLVAGKGPLEESLKLQAEILGLSDRVRFLGFVSHTDLPKLLKASDIFIRTPISEGFGNSYVEAMAAGLPCIATAVGGIVDFIRDGKTGVFVEVRNPESIAQGIMRLAKDTELYSTIKRNGFEMVKEKYDWEIVAREMKKIFEQV